MSHCGLGLSCEPICEHGKQPNKEQCIFCVLQSQIDEIAEKISEKYAHPDVITRLERLEQSRDANARSNRDVFDKLHELDKFHREFKNVLRKDIDDHQELIGSFDKRIDKLELKNIDRQIERICELEKKAAQAVSVQLMYSSNQAHDTWKSGCECLITEMQKQIHKLEENISAINKQKFSEFHHLRPDIEKLQSQINNWEEEFYFIKDKLRVHSFQPHKCPVCDGSGLNYSSDAIKHGHDTIGFYGKRENCKSCEGKGIVWG